MIFCRRKQIVACLDRQPKWRAPGFSEQIARLTVQFVQLAGTWSFEDAVCRG